MAVILCLEFLFIAQNSVFVSRFEWTQDTRLQRIDLLSSYLGLIHQSVVVID
jgi:hypothetical protein